MRSIRCAAAAVASVASVVGFVGSAPRAVLRRGGSTAASIDDFIAMKNKLPLGHAALVIDYAENYTHEPRRREKLSLPSSPFDYLSR